MSTYKLSDVTALNGNPVVQINNSDSVLGAVPGSLVQIGTEQIVFLDSVDIENSQITLTAPWPYADTVNAECTIAPITAVSSLLNAISNANQLISKTIGMAQKSTLFNYSSVAKIIAAVLSGELTAGISVTTDGYYDDSYVGDNKYLVVDVTVSAARPPQDNGRIIHVGNDGKYLLGLFPNKHICLEQFGYIEGQDAGPYLEQAKQYAATMVGDSNAPGTITLDGNYTFITTYVLIGALCIESRNASIITANNSFAIEVGDDTSGGYLTTYGSLHFTNDDTNIHVGGGIKGVHGAISLASITSQDLIGRILDCYTTKNKLNNSTVKVIKTTRAGGVRLQVVGGRGSMEVGILEYHCSHCYTECLIVKEVTDAFVGNVVGDTANGIGLNAIEIVDVSGCKFGNLWATARDAWGVVIESTDYTSSAANYLNQYEAIGCTDSLYGVSIDARSAQISMIRVVRAGYNSLVFGVKAGQLGIGHIVMSDGSKSSPSTALINKSSKPISINSIVSESSFDAAVFEIQIPQNGMTIGVIQTARALGSGQNVIWVDGVRPIDLQQSNEVDYPFKARSSNTTISGTGNFFNIPHGLVTAPQIFNVHAKNGAIPIVSVSANVNNLQVTFAESVTDPVFAWSAQVF